MDGLSNLEENLSFHLLNEKGKKMRKQEEKENRD
jgi:hypothetical protein